MPAIRADNVADALSGLSAAVALLTI